MVTKIRFTTHIKSVPYLIHTGVHLTGKKEISQFIMSETYKRYVTDSFMDRKKIKVTSIDVAEIENNKFSAKLVAEGGELNSNELEAIIEYFVFDTGNKGAVIDD